MSKKGVVIGESLAMTWQKSYVITRNLGGILDPTCGSISEGGGCGLWGRFWRHKHCARRTKKKCGKGILSHFHINPLHQSSSVGIYYFSHYNHSVFFLAVQPAWLPATESLGRDFHIWPSWRKETEDGVGKNGMEEKREEPLAPH